MSAGVRPVETRAVTEWAAEADVVVVGFGVAGACAAYEAAAAGASVLVLERSGGPGGASALSDGMVYLGGGTSTQLAAGVIDTPEAMRTFLLAACGPAPDAAKIDLYVERSVEHHDWLLARGVRFLGKVNPNSAGPSAADGEGLMFTGGENAWPFDDIAAPAQRAHVTQGARPGGSALMAALSDAVVEAGAKPMYDVRAERLIVEDGRVCGVVARRYGEQLAFRARGGVVLTAGGFAFDDDLLRAHAPAALRTRTRLGTDGDDGHGIRMAQAVGARVKRMDSLEWALPFNMARGNLSGILVNSLGRRFINEDTYMGRVGQAARNEEAVFLVVDEEHYDPDAFRVPATAVAETADELASEIGLPPGSLSATLAYYNEHAARGDDPLFHKRPQWLTPLTGPLAAFDLRPRRFPNAVFTLGGLDTLPTGEVLDAAAEPVPGLYAAGRTSSGVAASGYCSGLSLGDGSLFGRLAGLSAVRRD
ncbi:FAD-dependent oxidoreductase [Streptomyces sp. NPDC002787]